MLQKLIHDFSAVKFHASNNVVNHLEEDCFKFDDDWELIEVLDQEFNGERDRDDDVDMSHFEADESAFPYRLGSHKIKYRILSKYDLRHFLEEKVSKLCTVLSLSRSEAVVLLNRFKWSVINVHEVWLANEEKVRESVGLLKSPCAWFIVKASHTDEMNTDTITCNFCYENHVPGNMLAVSCGHQMCLTCWTEYISEAINNGPECLTLQCPEESCEAAVGIELVEHVSNQTNKIKYYDYLLKSYINASKQVKKCPAGSCEYAVMHPDGSDSYSDVTCKCLHSFCWNCSKEGHAPIDCGQVDEWMSETFVQSNNWLIAKARPCPSCEKLIEESSCTKYSQCALCKYTFNDDALPDVGENGDEDYAREFARYSLERYKAYYEGWSTCEASRENALTDLKVLKDIRLELLCDKLKQSEQDLDFLVEAHAQAVNSWRILKWVYAYGYFMPVNELLKKNLCDFLIEQAVKLVTMLEKHVDELVQGVLDGEISSRYNDNRLKIIQLTRVTRGYYERLVDALNDNLSEVVSISRSSPGCEDFGGNSRSPSPFQGSGPTRRVVKTEGEEGTSSSTVLIPGSFPQKERRPNLDQE